MSHNRIYINIQILNTVQAIRNVNSACHMGVMTDVQAITPLYNLNCHLQALFNDSQKWFSNDYQIRLAAERLDMDTIREFSAMPYPAR